MREGETDDRFYALIDHLSTDILITMDQFINLKGEWESLYNSRKNPCIFQSYEWNFTWWKHFGIGYELAIIAVYEKDRVVGIGPFIKKRRLGIPHVEIIGNDQHAYFGLLAEDGREDIVQAIAGKLVSLFPKGIVHIPYYQSGDWTVDVLMSSLMALGWKEHRWVRNISHYIYCDSGYEGYLSSKSSKSRRNLRYNRYKLERKGKVEIKHFFGNELDEKIIDKITKIQGLSWLARRGVDYLGTDYYRELFLKLGQNGNAEIFLMTIDGQDTAFILNYCSGDAHYAIFTGFNEKFDDVSPGQILWLDSIKSILDRNNKIYELPFGDAKYKRFWCNRTKRLFRSVCYRGVRGWILSWIPHRIHGTFAKYSKLRYIYQKFKRFVKSWK